MEQQDITVARWHALATEKLNEEQLLSASFTVNGSSMAPFIRYHRDEVTVQPVTRSLRPGDIVLFEAKRLGGNYVLHHVLKIKNGTVTTLGYNCGYPDLPIPEDKVIGIAVEVRRGKRIIRVDGWQWQTATTLWMWLLPVRKVLMAIRSVLKRGWMWIKRLTTNQPE